MTNYKTNPDYFDDDVGESLLEMGSYYFEFDDGSTISIDNADRTMTYPHRKTKLLWICEEVNNLIDKNQWDREQAIDYIEKNYA